ncbi:MAG TPA: DUF4058 family protein, partial [Tepidisphaeraceae bacterium]|nr:DUF4058 family protein [Tepidisphaeraceae bacterium]
MDPWLERFWGDVHHRLITYACDQIQELLPEGLLARMQERVFLEFPESVGRTVYPDGRIVETAPATPAAPPKAAGGVAVAEPLLVHLQSEPLTEGFIEVVDPASKGRVISVLEILSPANKAPGTGQSLYVQKQRELAAAGVSLVEVDLLRGGKRVTNAPPDILPRTHQTAYQACVRRATNSNVAEVYRIALREPLPNVGIPLRSQDRDVPLQLHQLLGEVYRRGRYGSSIDYREDPDPPLSAEDAA